jgi:hypothetical protein
MVFMHFVAADFGFYMIIFGKKARMSENSGHKTWWNCGVSSLSVVKLWCFGTTNVSGLIHFDVLVDEAAENACPGGWSQRPMPRRKADSRRE